MRKLETKTCETCNKEFQQGYTTSKKSWEKQKFCSFGCRRHTLESRFKMSEVTRNHPSTKRGSENPSWKGGITPKHNNLRGTLPFRIWRDAVNERDENICQECGVFCQKGNRVSHHVLELKDYPEYGTLIENGMTLCIPCHRTLHSKKNYFKRAIMAEEVLEEINAVYA